MQLDPPSFAAFNRRVLSRVYPRGTRLLSSNFDPVPAWLAGCQVLSREKGSNCCACKIQYYVLV